MSYLSTLIGVWARQAALRVLPDAIAPVSVRIMRKERKLFSAATSPNAHELGRSRAVSELLEYLRSPEFQMQPGQTLQISNGGVVLFESDMFGPEVKLFSGFNELLDCRPHSYRLKSAQAKAIYDAICDKAYGRDEPYDHTCE